jgi:hypothetical protein
MYKGFHVVRYQTSVVIVQGVAKDSQQLITGIDCEDSEQLKAFPWHE